MPQRPEQIIEGWALVPVGYSYQPPERGGARLTGRLPDGRQVVTSRIKKLEAGCVVTASGSRYRLGQPDAGYERQFPRARERLFGGFETA
jgi:hypothetical protein